MRRFSLAIVFVLVSASGGAVADPAPVAHTQLCMQMQAQIRLGFQQHNAGQYLDAAQTFLSVAEHIPAARALAARSLMEAGNLPEAEAQANEAVQAAGNVSAAHFVLALVSERRGQMDAAIAEYQQVLAMNPSDGAAYNNLGGIYYLRENFDEARTETEQALRLTTDPEGTAIAMANLAEFDALQGQLPAAEEKLNQALSAAPESAVPYFALATLYDALGRTEAAATMEKNALKLDPHGATRRAMAWVWPELQLQSEGLLAEAQGDRTTAIEKWTALQTIELTTGLHWSALKGVAAAHLKTITIQSPAIQSVHAMAPVIDDRLMFHVDRSSTSPWN